MITCRDLPVRCARLWIDRARAQHRALVRVGRGTYALPGLDDARIAALAHGWPVRSRPARPELIVPSKRKVVPARRRDVDLRWRALDPTDLVDGSVTGALRTVVDCARDLPLTEALSVADSAIRSGAVTVADLHEAGCELPRAGRRQARLVLEADSHEFHTSRSQIRRDCWRYDEFILAGWLRLRFAWDHVMHQEEWVRDVVTRGVELRRSGFAA